MRTHAHPCHLLRPRRSAQPAGNPGTARHSDLIPSIAAGAAVLALALGVRHAFGLFLQPMTAAHGWSRELFALGIAAQNLLWGSRSP